MFHSQPQQGVRKGKRHNGDATRVLLNMGIIALAQLPGDSGKPESHIGAATISLDVREPNGVRIQLHR